VQQLQFLSAKRLSLVLRERPVSLAFSLADYLSSQTSSMRQPLKTLLTITVSPLT
jgi:hypothetical protein